MLSSELRALGLPIICIDIHHVKAFCPRRSVNVACEAHDLDVADLIVRTNTRDVRMEFLGVRLWLCVTSIAGPNGAAQLYER